MPGSISDYLLPLDDVEVLPLDVVDELLPEDEEEPELTEPEERLDDPDDIELPELIDLPVEIEPELPPEEILLLPELTGTETEPLLPELFTEVLIRLWEDVEV